MLTRDETERLCRVSPGTPMGFYDPFNGLVGNRIQNAAAWRPTWNAQDWQVN